MSQWGQQPSYQYPLQTGFQGNLPQFQQVPQLQQQNPQFQPQNPQFQLGLTGPPQQQGFSNGPPGGFQQPQPTGFPSLQQQPTGFVGGLFQQQQPRQNLPPPVPPIPTQFQQQNQAPSFLSLPPQPPLQANRFLSSSPGVGGSALGSNFTSRGNGAMGGPIVPQVTGFVDPRLQMMSSTFMPVNLASPYGAGGAPQLPQQQLPGGLSLQQSFQRHNEERRGTAAPNIQWALSKAEKKNYDTIFRAWDTQGNGFISGQAALEVFGQSGLSKEELADIWHLADIDNKGKLNMAEFHVAMGLIFRRLNGSEIPQQLPPELVPPSSRDLDSSVDTLKRILEHETRSRSPTSLDAPVSRLKERSFTGNSSIGAGGRQDATVYKHTDAEPPGGFYTPASRRVDRTTVRSRSDEDSPAADLSDMKRQLENTARMLDRAAEDDASRTAEDEALDREMQDLRYRVKRVQEDLDYLSRGPKTASKNEDRRRLERQLLELMHDRVPEVERKIEERERRREREKRDWEDARNRRNERHGRYNDLDDRYSSSASPRRYSRERDDHNERAYSRNAYDRDDRDSSYRRDSSRNTRYDRPRSPSPPPPAPSSSASLPPPAPRPTPSPAPNTKNMTPEERQAFLRAEAKRRIDARTQALGLTAPASAPGLDTTVEERLAQEKREAEEKAREAEKQAEERERLRRARLEGEKALKESRTTPVPAPTPAVPIPTAAPSTPAARPAPPTVKARPPPPPLPRKAPAPQPPAARRPSAPPAPLVPAIRRTQPAAPIPPVEPEVDPEEEKVRARQEVLLKQRAERAARLRQLEKDEEDARLAEEEYQTRRQAFLDSKARSPVASPPVNAPAFAPPQTAPAPPAPVPTSTTASPPVPAAAVTPPISAPPSTSPSSAPLTSPSTDKSSRNPFSRLMKESGASSPSASLSPTKENTNPFPRSQTAPSPTAQPPSKVSTPAAVKTSYHTAPGNSDDEDWDQIQDKDVDDSSDDEFGSSRDKRSKLAKQLFSSILPPARPPSAPTGTALSNPATPTTPAASVPPPPPPMLASSVAIADAPAAPMPPPPPPAPAAVAPSTGPDDISALLLGIKGGLKLKKVQTVDRSGPVVTGKVLGEDSAPQPRFVEPVGAEPPLPASMPMSSDGSNSSHRQSMDWYAGLAADAGSISHLPSMAEEDERQDIEYLDPIPQIQVVEPDTQPDPLADVDKSVEHRVRSLYAYEGDRAEDLSFGEDVVIVAHPSISGSDWWYGTINNGGKSGFFPKTYVELMQPVIATALYSYDGGSANELSFAEGDELWIVDTNDTVWWKAEVGGAILLVPASYVELIKEVPAGEVQDVHVPRADFGPSNGEVGEEVDDTPDSSSVSSLEISDESEDDENAGESKEERAVREEKEHQQVLQVAGLIVTADAQPPRDLKRKRRPAPAAPKRSSVASNIGVKDLPPLPQEDPAGEAGIWLDDAFDRYEAFKHSHGNVNRMSVASIETLPSSPGASSIAPSLSRESASRGHSTFLHFLGRKSPSSEPDKRRVSISAPIMINPTPPSREQSPAFGTSWASLVNKTVLDEIPADERRRQEAIFEMITTEAAYVRDLQLIVEVFYSSMVPLLDTKAVTVVFANVEDLLLVNTAFLSALEERQKECRLYVDNIGDILIRHISNMNGYMEYCVNQSTAIKVLQSLRESNSALASHLQRLRDDPAVRNLDLASYLLCPMQRITKYPLLIRQILHHPTEMAQDRKEVESSLHMAEKILSSINDTIREQEGRERLKEVSKHLWIGQGRLDLTANTRYMGPRKLLREGTLSKAKSGRKLRVFLCSDVMVLTDEVAKTLYRMPIRLAEVGVKESPGGRDDLCFQIVGRDGTTTVLRAPSVRECQLWMEAIASAGKLCRKAEKASQKK